MSKDFIHIEEKGIKYLVHPKGSIFEGMKIRENLDDAFDNAIKRGMKNPEDWMYIDVYKRQIYECKWRCIRTSCKIRIRGI